MRWDWDAAARYLAVAAKNAALDLLKKEKWTASMPEDWDPPAPESGAGEYERLVALILSLPEDYRRVLELKFVEEETNQEIARAAGTQGVHGFHQGAKRPQAAAGRHEAGGLLQWMTGMLPLIPCWAAL